MKKYWLIGITIVGFLLLTASVAFLQDETTEQVETQTAVIEIIWPTPATEHSGIMDVFGTANIPDMQFYRIEIVPMNDDLTVSENAGWIPISEDFTEPVEDDVLATVDTTQIPDGLYGLRMVMNIGKNATEVGSLDTITGPIRFSNQFAAEGEEPEEPVPPEVPDEGPPLVIARAEVPAVNVRYCDRVDNEGCPVLGFMSNQEYGELLGHSSSGTGWYFTQTASGLQG
ncbi:MAG: hypothetical protein GY796_35905 [Chloroflexi bacterium]|nr:hypothetical protein [Chloroflexota bacterium]